MSWKMSDFPSLLYCQVYVSYKDNVRILNPEVQISFFILVQFAIESFITINRVATLAFFNMTASCENPSYK